VAFCVLTASPGARAHYDTIRACGTGHHAALRQLANHLVGILHGCLRTRTPYREHTAWSDPPPQPIDTSNHEISGHVMDERLTTSWVRGRA
jgi:hypothetical protein